MRAVALLLIAVFAAYAAYFGWRIVEARRLAPDAVAALLADADPADEALSAERKEWFVKVEDPTFWTNDGVDEKTPGAGRTTIAQGLGKRLFFKRFSPGPLKLGKLELMAMTRFALIPAVSKNDILAAAIATLYLGSDESGAVNGFAEGARRWFGKELGALSDEEFLSLVAMAPAPNRFRPGGAANAERVGRIRRYLDGACAPKNVDDIYYEACAR
ncbi:MAG: transglycosylase domain-containing protein [Parvularculaceae bacterium]|nr:transglycosylase domain-containing protein [Parvularculaceae bacterium]